MEVLTQQYAAFNSEKTALTIGMFDGVHRGHQQIIEQLNIYAERHNQRSCLFTFWPHPRLVLQKDTALKLLNTKDEKMQLLQGFGLDSIYFQDFTTDFSKLNSEEFVRDFLVNKLNVGSLVIGHDHQFGKNRQGDFSSLKALSKKYGFEVFQLDAITEKSLPISSTKIRNALTQGDLSYSNEALGYAYMISGEVVTGDGIGRTLGFPTVNLQVSTLKLLPKDGVYGVTLNWEEKLYFGLLNIGNRPTFNGSEHRIEIYVLDFEGDLYNEMLQIHLLIRLRDEMRFVDKQQLVAQIKKDEQIFRDYLKSNL
ncbi:MAG: bifunctional riboflavin kinase/FAD synthetase [Flavobacteriaceae bacterium]|nr:bifunctional riboflavin kinase/FAD synthetase [Flavobacteriaceae bacterium]